MSLPPAPQRRLSRAQGGNIARSRDLDPTALSGAEVSGKPWLDMVPRRCRRDGALPIHRFGCGSSRVLGVYVRPIGKIESTYKARADSVAAALGMGATDFTCHGTRLMGCNAARA